MVDLTIVIVSFNTMKMTRDCLVSVYSGIGKLSVQIVVVDNDSTDGSVEMIRREFPGVELIRNFENKGFAAANNQGFEIARGKYFLLLNSDTIVLRDTLIQSFCYLESNKLVGAMGCRVLNTDGSMQPTCSGFPTVFRLTMMTAGLDRIFPALDSYRLCRWSRDTEREVEVVSGCYLFVRREVFEQIGGLDEEYFFFGEETDWCLRMRKAGWRLMFAPVGEIIHHGGGSVKKLQYRRDVMLTEATVRLHRKNCGLISTLGTFMVLALFNSSRAVMWAAVSLFKPEARSRAKHFINVALRIFSTWPKGN